MHPNPICPKCLKLVYAAEQIMGPGRKLYHKPCLSCTICKKRLETSTLLEHDLEPYCKLCHLKNFGTRDLRHANLPNAALPSNSETSSSPTKNVFSPQPLLRPLNTGGPPLPRLKPNRSLATSPISPTFIRGSSPTSSAFQVPLSTTPTATENSTSPTNDNAIPEEEESDTDALEQEQDRDFVSESSTSPSFSSPYPSNTGRPGIGTIPRTIPLYLNNGNGSRTGYNHHTSHSVGSIPSNYSPTKGEGEEVTESFSGSVPRNNSGSGRIALDRNLGTYGNFTPLKQTSTGTRYGVALTGGVGVHMTGSASPSPRKWGAGTPVCPRCMKNVYFAEQIKAVGKTFHKTCLRCVECGTSLHSNKLLDHDGEPFCVRCHNKLYGPQGNGYALLGKAGG